jgi:hypothetical protein
MTLVPQPAADCAGRGGRGDETRYQAATRSTATASVPVSVPAPLLAVNMTEILVLATGITNNG